MGLGERSDSSQCGCVKIVGPNSGRHLKYELITMDNSIIGGASAGATMSATMVNMLLTEPHAPKDLKFKLNLMSIVSHENVYLVEISPAQTSLTFSLWLTTRLQKLTSAAQPGTITHPGPSTKTSRVLQALN